MTRSSSSLVFPASPTLSEALAHADGIIAGAVDRIGSLIADFERTVDNPMVKRFSESPNTFVISSKGLTLGSWDPFAHDWRAQFKVALELVQERRFLALSDLLEGKKINLQQYGRISLAPQVAKLVKTVIGDLSAVAVPRGGVDHLCR